VSLDRCILDHHRQSSVAVISCLVAGADVPAYAIPMRSSATAMTVADNLHQDVKGAPRGLWNSRGFAAAALVTLALGI